MDFVATTLIAMATGVVIGQMVRHVPKSSYEGPQPLEEPEVNKTTIKRIPQDVTSSVWGLTISTIPRESAREGVKPSLTQSQEYELRMAESKRLDSVCRTSVDGIISRWKEEARNTTFSSGQIVDNRYSKMINDLIEKCKSH